MFCTMLRRRPSYASIVPTLTASTTPQLRESRLTTHDIEIPLNPDSQPHTAPGRKLRFLLLSPSTTSDANLPITIERIQHFASLTGGQDLAIIFLLQPPPLQPNARAGFVTAKQLTATTDGMLAYTTIQATLTPHSSIPHIPILPLTKLENLPGLLRRHVASATAPRPAPPPKPAGAFDLLQICTSSPQMRQETAFYLTDLFPNIRELAEACTSVGQPMETSSPSVRAAGTGLSQSLSLSSEVGGYGTQRSEGVAEGRLRKLRDLVGEREFAGVLEFWRSDWTVD